jgi:hypothetical protein
MANKTYPNHVLANNFENQYATKLDLMQFCTVDDSLVGVAGDTVKINTYTATDGTETLAMGEGNTKDIEVSYETKDYTIELLQNRFSYFDEEEMRDPKIVEKGLNHGVVDMFNTAQNKAMAEFSKATLEAEVDKFDFDAFVDGAALFDDELGELSVFALVHKDDVKEIRKNLKDSLQYVEAYVRKGYIGTVNGINIISTIRVFPAHLFLQQRKLLPTSVRKVQRLSRTEILIFVRTKYGIVRLAYLLSPMLHRQLS